MLDWDSTIIVLEVWLNKYLYSFDVLYSLELGDEPCPEREIDLDSPQSLEIWRFS